MTWTAAPLAVSYVIDLGRPPGCESIANDVAVTGTSYESPSLPDGQHCWRVASVDANGIQSVFSLNSSFGTIPVFATWGIVFLVVAVVASGVLFQRWRAA